MIIQSTIPMGITTENMDGDITPVMDGVLRHLHLHRHPRHPIMDMVMDILHHLHRNIMDITHITSMTTPKSILKNMTTPDTLK